eukprot:3458327-Amphidinium_carterae.1
MQEDGPSGAHAEGAESAKDFPSGAHAEGGIPGQNEMQDADPSGAHARGEAIQPAPGLDMYVRPTSKAMARQTEYRPSHRLRGKQSPPIVAQLDEVQSTKELRLRNNEDEQENDRMESIMDNILVQPWWQYEDEVT